ncbi:DUF4417 domain-containing protein [Dialister sp.]|uniref:DUF4417 domain-containing protein n=1 Tax=Dialister sp. TaxID=1955814 RepID=UPI002E81ABEE|nr:DUF4417 domain-containing protein [Dialister sp.]MEE3452407.1 DUF4417 domain-containing protein [Dialister sp.]
MRRRKLSLDDGCNPELFAGSRFDGILEFPIVERPSHFIIPDIIVPFSERKKAGRERVAIGFYEEDIMFADLIRNPQNYVDELLKFTAVITPDCSLYYDAPFMNNLINIYRNRIIGSYLQKKGCYVIPQVRWGDERTYTKCILKEQVAFLGIVKHSIVSIGTYGQLKSKLEKYNFKCGLEEMLKTLEPEIVLVYGTMPDSIFGDYRNVTRFYHYDNWIKIRHMDGGKYGKR